VLKRRYLGGGDAVERRWKGQPAWTRGLHYTLSWRARKMARQPLRQL